MTPGGPYRKPFGSYSKTASISAAVKAKNENIRKYTDAKSVSIAISSAFNMSAERCNALISVGKLDDENYWEAHESYFHEYLERFLDKQEAGASANSRQAELYDKSFEVRDEVPDGEPLVKLPGAQKEDTPVERNTEL